MFSLFGNIFDEAVLHPFPSIFVIIQFGNVPGKH